MIKIFSIEFPDELGETWMNKDNLLVCLKKTCPNTEFKVKDLTTKAAKSKINKEGIVKKEQKEKDVNIEKCQKHKWEKLNFKDDICKVCGIIHDTVKDKYRNR